MKAIRIQKALANAGIVSRREAELLILQQRIKVNGKIIKSKGFKINPYKDIIEVDNKQINLFVPKVYYLFNKPQGVICSLKDEKGRKKIIDFLPSFPFKIYPVGRLDYNSEGLIIVTNDGDLANKIMHPSHKIEKVYRVKISGNLSKEKMNLLKQGIYLDKVKIKPLWMKILKKNKNTWLELSIVEGKKHEIRRIFKYLGHFVMRLKRIAIGPIRENNLKPGQFRELTEKEIKILKNL